MYPYNPTASFMMPSIPYMQMPIMNKMTLGGLSQAGKTNLLGGIKGLNFPTILNNVSKTLGVVKEAIPIVKEVKPMMTNMKSMINVAKAFNDITDEKINKPKDEKENTTDTINNVSSINQNTPNFFL